MDDLAKRLMERLRAPLRAPAKELPGGASVAAARFIEARGSSPGLGRFAQADAALDAAKLSGGNRYQVASPERRATWRWRWLPHVDEGLHPA